MKKLLGLRTIGALAVLAGLAMAPSAFASHGGSPYHGHDGNPAQYPMCSDDPNTPSALNYCNCEDDPNQIGANGESLPIDYTATANKNGSSGPPPPFPNPNPGFGTGRTCDPCANDAWGTQECPSCPAIPDPNVDPNIPQDPNNPTMVECSWMKFCGTVGDSTQGMTNHGVVITAPYVGQMFFVHRPPDVQESHSTAAEWDCSDSTLKTGQKEGGYCGEFRLKLQDFGPPQTAYYPVDLHGRIEGVDQGNSSYHLQASLDEFVIGPGAYEAVGEASATILCVGCGAVNDKTTLPPDYQDFIGNISGEIILGMQIPGVGGSLSPLEGNVQDVRLEVTQIGGACNSILPATSSWGLVGLVALMVVTSVFFAGSKLGSNEAKA